MSTDYSLGRFHKRGNEHLNINKLVGSIITYSCLFVCLFVCLGVRLSCIWVSRPCGSCRVNAFRGALFPSKAGLMNKHIVKHIIT